MKELHVGKTTLTPCIDGAGMMRSLGGISVGNAPLRDPAGTWLPWLDTFDGVVFDQFRWTDAVTNKDGLRIKLTALGRQDFPFQERRDMSGDICLRAANWDAPPVEAALDIVFEPVQDVIDGREFTGLRYWYEYDGATEIHRMFDRQTWAPGGVLQDHRICCRNWAHPTRSPIGLEDGYSTAALDMSHEALAKVNPMPGNLWARWSLLPGFEMIYSAKGVLLGRYDRVSLVRSVLETLPGEESLRIVDAHYFEKTKRVATNPKTILWCDDSLDDIDALNLWTRLTDRDCDMAQKQFGIAADGPPRIEFAKNVWVGINFENTYNDTVDAAAELGADCVFIDSVWESAEALNMEVRDLLSQEQLNGTVLDKRCKQSMCCTMDFKVAEVMGGEDGLRRLCERAKEKGVDILSWMATHLSPVSNFRENAHPELGRGDHGIFAARESGRHPDTGYAGDCWPLNLNAPIREYVRDQILGICERTGLAGFLWDSFSNLGWWHVDYSDGSMRPQFDRMAELYAALSNAGLYLMPEALAAVSNHSCLGLLSGDMIDGGLEGFMYNTAVAFPHSLDDTNGAVDKKILRGEAPLDPLFRAFAHKWIPNSEMGQIPRDEWDSESAEEIKRLYTTYRQLRDQMIVRTVLKDDLGVKWQNDTGSYLLWCFRDQPAPGPAEDACSGKAAGQTLSKNRVYRFRK